MKLSCLSKRDLQRTILTFLDNFFSICKIERIENRKNKSLFYIRTERIIERFSKIYSFRTVNAKMLITSILSGYVSFLSKADSSDTKKENSEKKEEPFFHSG
jgi:hypothetical protein